MFMETWTLNGSGEWVDKDGGIHVVDTTLSEVIRARRKYLGLTQREVTRRMFAEHREYCSPQLLNNIEMGKRTGRAYWNTFSKVLGIPIEVLCYYGFLKDCMPQKSYAYHIIVNAMRGMKSCIDMYEQTYTPMEKE